MHESFFLSFPLCTGPDEENGVQIFDEESCGDAQDLSSPDEEVEHVCYLPLVVSQVIFQILMLLFEIALLINQSIYVI